MPKTVLHPKSNKKGNRSPLVSSGFSTNYFKSIPTNYFISFKMVYVLMDFKSLAKCIVDSTIMPMELQSIVNVCV